MTLTEAVQAQLDEYNARDVDAFLRPYHAGVELARLPGGEVFARGHDAMRAIYAELFRAAPDLHCRLVQRVCHDRFVDEEVTGHPKAARVGAVAIYEAEVGLIRRAWFLQ